MERIEGNTTVLDGEIVTGIKMSDGSPVRGYVVGSTPFVYILSVEEIENALCTGEQQVEVHIVAERVLPHT